MKITDFSRTIFTAIVATFLMYLFLLQLSHQPSLSTSPGKEFDLIFVVKKEPFTILMLNEAISDFCVAMHVTDRLEIGGYIYIIESYVD